MNNHLFLHTLTCQTIEYRKVVSNNKTFVEEVMHSMNTDNPFRYNFISCGKCEEIVSPGGR